MHKIHINSKVKNLHVKKLKSSGGVRIFIANIFGCKKQTCNIIQQHIQGKSFMSIVFGLHLTLYTTKVQTKDIEFPLYDFI